MNRKFGRFSRVVAVLVVVLVLGGGGLMPAAAQGNATVVVTLVDENFAPLPGGCLLALGETVYSFVCDGRDDGLADGVVTYSVPPGNYFIVVSQAPPGYAVGTRAPITVTAGETLNQRIPVYPGGFTLVVESVGSTGQPLGQACYDLYWDLGSGQPERLFSTNCDAAQGDSGDGRVEFPGITARDYILVQSQTPAGYFQPDNLRFTVPDGTSDFTVTMRHDSTSPSLVDQLIAVLIAILQQILGN